MLELLLVLVIAGIMLGVVTLSGVQNERQALQNDAQRIALLMQLARDEAILRNQPIVFEADTEGYRFLMRDGATWKPIEQDALLRERAFNRAPVSVSVDPNVAIQNDPLRLVFGREPVDKPFLLSMMLGDSSVAIRADGIGHFYVE